MLFRLLVPILLFAAAEPVQGPIRFEDVTRKAGIAFQHSFGAEQLGSLLESTGAGAVWFDYNNDGYQDLYVVSGRPLGPGMHPYPLRKAPDPMPHNHLYRNNRDGTFTDVTAAAGVAPDLFSMAAIAADYDNDGNEDLLVTGYGRVVLYRNRGDGTFEDVTAKAGLEGRDLGFSFGVAAGDYDNDGNEDLFICNAGRNTLYHNNGDGTFTDVTIGSGLEHKPENLLSVAAAWFDYDNDGLLDLIISNYTIWTPETDQRCLNDAKQDLACSPTVYKSVSSRLYHNLGMGNSRM